MQDYRKLDVWTKAHELALEVHRVTASGTNRVEATLVDGLRHSAASIPLTIVWACGLASSVAFADAMDDAALAVDRLSYLLVLARDSGELGAVPFAKLEARAEQLRAMLGGFNRTVRRKLAAPGGAASRIRLMEGVPPRAPESGS